jgi:hypothetical protein
MFRMGHLYQSSNIATEQLSIHLRAVLLQSEKYGKNYIITHQNTLLVRKIWLDPSMNYEHLIKKIGRKMKARKCATMKFV